MEKYISYEKLSKKKKRELDAKRRTVWTISPVTRKPVNSKAYNRKKAQKWRDDPGFCAFDLSAVVYSMPVTVTPQSFVTAGMRKLSNWTVSAERYISRTKSCISPEMLPPETGVTVSPSCQ